MDDDDVGEAADAEGQEGIEGVDWRYGSVDELDAREWQVRCLFAHCCMRTLHGDPGSV